MRIRPATVDALIWTALLGVFALLASRYVVAAIDDLYIILRYVQMAADGHGLVYNLGERVEGYTCFGWVLLLVGLARLGWPAYWAAKFISLLCGIITIWFAHRIAREFWHGDQRRERFAFIPAAAVAVNPSFLYWSVAGLETMFFTMFVIGVLYLLVLESRLAREGAGSYLGIALGQGVLCSAAALTRPEGMALLAFAFVARVIMWRARRRWLWHSLLLFVTGVAPVFLYLLWRHAYYGEWLPNTYYAKVGGSVLYRIAQGWRYTQQAFAENAFGWIGDHGQTAWPGIIIFLAVPVLATPWLQRKRAHLLCLALMGMSMAIVLWEGGDWMRHTRFLVPVIVVWIILLSHASVAVALKLLNASEGGLRRVCAIALVGTVPLLSLDYLTLNFRGPVGSTPDRPDSWAASFSRYILESSPDGTLAVSDIGYIGFKTRYRILDIVGLVDRHIAHAPGRSYHKDYDPSYILNQDPDFVVLTDQQCLPEIRLRNHVRFKTGYRFVRKIEGHALYERIRDQAEAQRVPHTSPVSSPAVANRHKSPATSVESK